MRHKEASCSARLGSRTSLEAPGEAGEAQGRGDVQQHKDGHQAAEDWPILQHTSKAGHHLPSKQSRLSARRSLGSMLQCAGDAGTISQIRVINSVQSQTTTHDSSECSPAERPLLQQAWSGSRHQGA